MAKVILYCVDTVGKSMSGPAIRYWEFAHALCQEHEVILLTPNQSDMESLHFKIACHHGKLPSHALQGADVLISQMISPRMAYLAKKRGIKMILDAYDPLPLEHLEIYKEYPFKERHERNIRTVLDLELWFKMADGMICASEKQRDLWMGLLMGQKRLTPALYDQDKSLRNLIDVVPFGLNDAPPQKQGRGMRELYGLSPKDKVLLWGGGIWNWFDPLTLIKAIKRLSIQRSDIKLVFMGVTHPNANIPKMEMSVAAIELAKQLGLLDRHVFFNYGWVPYQERQNFLLEADVGVSTHLEHLETRYSFRTRMLDYIWAGLPILATTGDSFAELIEAKGLGAVVPYQDEHAMAEAIQYLVDDIQRKEEIQKRLGAIRKNFTWEYVTKPLQSMIKRLTTQAKSSRFNQQELITIVRSFTKQKASVVRQKGIFKTLQALPAYVHKKLFK